MRGVGESQRHYDCHEKANHRVCTPWVFVQGQTSYFSHYVDDGGKE
jgi:hypothetical protein